MNYLYLYSVFIFGSDLAEIGNPHPGARSARRAIILRCELSEIYLPQVGSPNEMTYFLTYLYLISASTNYVSKFLVFL